jgi:hypothetical protein
MVQMRVGVEFEWRPAREVVLAETGLEFPDFPTAAGLYR